MTSPTTLDLPLGTVASFLPLPGVLSMRFVSKEWLDRLHEGLDASTCAQLLGEHLRARHLVLAPDTLNQWKLATNSDTEQLEKTLRSQMTNFPDDSYPLDCLLRICRVAMYMPRRMTVRFNGGKGRYASVARLEPHGEGEVRTWSEYRYGKCHRGKKNNCPTCSFQFPTVPIDEIVPGDTVDTRLRIELPGDRRLLLSHYYNNCLSNLPSDLTCPMCRETEFRTLVLSEFTYQTTPGTERTHRRNETSFPLTFTPKMSDESTANDSASDSEESDDEANSSANSPSPRKKRRLSPMDDSTFPPPRYRNFDYFPDIYDRPQLCPYTDLKLAMSIHCEHCRQFGLFAPANARRTETADGTSSRITALYR